MIDIRPVTESVKKSQICDTVLHALPNWFGIESSIVDYIADTQTMPYWVAYDGEQPIGFVALKEHNAYTSEVYVMGILESYHRQGIGRALIQRCEVACAETGHKFLTVKTLDEAHPDPGYAKTRQFYLAMGFLPLEVFPLHWDESNPCLFLAKAL